MEKCLISIIVPVYNVEKYLDRCMRSLLRQTYRNIEIIMVDDGSTDSCSMKCDEYAKADHRVVVIHKKNEGLGFARNSGIKAAKGKFIAFIDSDDYADKSMIEKLYTALLNNNADTCFCRYYDVLADGTPVQAREDYQKEKYYGNDVKKLILGMIGSAPDKKGDVEIGMSVWKGLYSATIIHENMIFFPSEREYISEDIIFHIAYLEYANTVAIDPGFYYYYCDNGSSLTKSYNPVRFQMEKKLYFKEKELLSRIFPTSDYETRLNKSFIGRVRRCISQEIFSDSDRISKKKKVREICSDEVVQTALQELRKQKIGFPKREINLLIQKKCYMFLKFVFQLQNKLL